ncbi:hypothetical protein CDL15_Pgr003548 [Punica granatum]|uniref:Ribosome biogenesis regulatory protein n=1 Tax=Punica granatum TaxID=22663 RepID=A0A218X2E8_PUNGR|nr:hypothetical protein CDL15_Pgr003548 [Punica granatum]
MEMVDLGHLMAFDPTHQFSSLSSSREELVENCLQKGRELVQAVANALFSLPSTEDLDGPIVKLPPPTKKRPRVKHVKSHCLVCYYWHREHIVS